MFCPHRIPALWEDVLHYLPSLNTWTGPTINPLGLSFCVTASLNRLRRYRNINLLSIAYDSLVLGLGPDLPWADEPSPGNLRLSTEEFLAPLSLLMPAFSLPYSPRPLALTLLRVRIAPLPTILRMIPKLRCQVLAPVIFGATSLDQ